MMTRLIIPSVCLLIVLSDVGKVMGETGWEYVSPLGPDTWHTKFEQCGGRMQSPINIETHRVVYDRTLDSFDVRQYADLHNVTMTLENVAGHTVEVVYEGDPITIRGGSLPDEYVLDQFHFHWGDSDDVGSEHLLNSQSAPMEMHIVHHSKKLGRAASSTTPYGLAVLAFFFQIGDHNPKFDAFLQNFPSVVKKGAQTAIALFPLADLVGKQASGYYYRYFGSLTTPPCYQTVIWTLFQDNIVISRRQLDMFRSLRTQREGEPTEAAISNNFRPPQPLHKRTVTSNDPSLLQDSATYLVTDLREEVKTLQLRCSQKSSSGGMGVMRNGWGVSSACVYVVMVWVMCIVQGLFG